MTHRPLCDYLQPLAASSYILLAQGLLVFCPPMDPSRSGIGKTSRMRWRAQSAAALASLLVCALPGPAASADAFDVAFYELTETMMFDGVTRTGAGELAGEAAVGRSPLCPRDMVESLAAAGLARRDRPCYVTAVGRDVLSLATLGGIFEADIQVKVQADNPVDAPELVVMVAKIAGELRIVDAELRLLAISRGMLTITRVLDPTTFRHVSLQRDPVLLTGMVRLPFAIGPTADSAGHAAVSQPST